MNRLVHRAVPAAFLVLAACASRTPVALAPLADHPWTVLPGDEVRVRVYRELELNGQWLVNSRGEVMLPGLGRQMVAGLTVDSLTDLITAGYTKRIIDAVVDVGLSRMIPVIGDVAAPGVFAAEPSMTLQQLVAKAGGLRVRSLRTPLIQLKKGRDGTRYALAADVRLDRVPLDDGDAIFVVDPGFLERWNSTLDAIYRVGVVITIVSQIYLLTKR